VNKNKTTISTLLLLTGLFGCDSKTAPTPQNFTQTLNAFYLEHSECLFPDAPRFPLETSDPAQIKQFNSLVKAQLLDAGKETGLKSSRYTLTTAGSRYAPHFCYGHRSVTAIDSSTPPAPENGFPTTHVTYRYKLEDVPIWAKTPEVQAAFPAMAKAISSESGAQAPLAKTIAGWTVPN
jgi:hypothetical protein